MAAKSKSTRPRRGGSAPPILTPREIDPLLATLLLLARHRKATRVALGMRVTGDRSAAERIIAAARRG
jgi:hypothetical protein